MCFCLCSKQHVPTNRLSPVLDALPGVNISMDSSADYRVILLADSLSPLIPFQTACLYIHISIEK